MSAYKSHNVLFLTLILIKCLNNVLTSFLSMLVCHNRKFQFIFFPQLHQFTKRSSIPEIYFRNNVTLTGKVVKVHNNGSLGVLHLPLLWRARIKCISNPGSTINRRPIQWRTERGDQCLSCFLLVKESKLNHTFQFSIAKYFNLPPNIRVLYILKRISVVF